MEIPFTVSARTAKLIGLENFSNPEGAVVELVKNTYDADSQCCFILFDKDIDGKTNMSIVDYGCGMTAETIMERWMCIGTDDKLYNELSAKGRVKSGAKGIGRFALNRLGQKTEMLTYTDEGAGHRWTVDWKGFDKPGANVSEVMAILDAVPFDAIKNKVDSIVSLFGLNEIPVFKHGTILEIKELQDIWDENTISKLYENLRGIIPPFDIPTFSIYLHSTDNVSAYGKVEVDAFEDFDYKVSAHYLGDESRSLEVDIVRNELDIERLKEQYKGLFLLDMMKEFPYRLEDFERGGYHLSLSLSNLKNVDKRLLDEFGEELGKFDFSFYFVKNTLGDRGESNNAKYPYRSFSVADRRLWMNQNVGVKIYRDNFRVRPYGENGDDWLRLAARYTKNPAGAAQRLGGYYIRNNQIVGAVEISRLTNRFLQDKSSREGLQENAIFELFKQVLVGIIALFERDRNVVMHSLKRLYDMNNPQEQARKEADSVVRAEFSRGNYEKVQKGYEAVKQELKEKEEELRLLRNLASTGLVITSFAHELRNITNLLNARSVDLKEALQNIITPEEIKARGVDFYENPYTIINELGVQDRKIRGWLEFSLNSIRRDKRDKSDIFLGDYFANFKATWSSVLNELNIQMYIHGFTNEMVVNGYWIDLDTVFNNLLSNAIYAIKETKRSENRTIEIEGSMTAGKISVKFIDSGIGLSDEYKTQPEKIFEAFETSKYDEDGKKIGTGLGLYITRTTLEQYKYGRVSLISELKIGFGVVITLNGKNIDL